MLAGCATEAGNKKASDPVQASAPVKHEAKVRPQEECSINIQPYGGIPEELVNPIYQELCKIHEHVILLKSIPLPAKAFYSPRNRYKADTLIAMLSDSTEDGCVTIGLTIKDISTTKDKIPDWGVMGLGYEPGKACVVSAFRLSKNNLREQYFKVVIHELGHTQGLPHCPDKHCYMSDAEGKNTTDNETGFCDKCKKYLTGKGWKL